MKTKTWPADKVEEWRAIPFLDGYEASSEGRIRSLNRWREFNGRWGPTRRFHAGRVLSLKMKPNGCGSVYPSFYSDGGVYIQANRAVAHAFHGAPPTERHEAAHLDGDTMNNRPENLAWKTHVENEADKLFHGTSPRGIRNGKAVLTDDVVRHILRRYAAGERAPALAEYFEVSAATIRLVCRGQHWSHVDSPHREAAKAMLKKNMIDAPRERRHAA